MLWVVKDNRYDFDGGGPEVTIVRARDREEALRLWAENTSELFYLTGELDKSEQKVFDDLKEHDRPLTVRVQVFALKPEGESGVLVDRDTPELPAEPSPKRPEVTMEGIVATLDGPPTLRSPTLQPVRVVCGNQLSMAMDLAKAKRCHSR